MPDQFIIKENYKIKINQKDQLNQKHIEDKQELITQLNQRIKLDQKIQKDVILQLQTTLQEISKCQTEIKQFKLFNENYQKIEELLIQQIENFKPIQNIFINLIIKSIQSSTKIENTILDDQTAYLKAENDQLICDKEDIKQLSLLREKTFKQEIQRNKDKCEYLTQQIETREKQYISDLNKIKLYIEQIEKNYEPREKCCKFNSEELQQLLDNFRIITQQIFLKLKNRKGNELYNYSYFKLKQLIIQSNFSSIYTQILEIIKEKQECPAIEVNNSKEIEHISQLRQLEQEPYKKEIDIA